MKFILLLLLTTVCLMGCESNEVIQGRKAYENYLKGILKDPESLRVYQEKIITQGYLGVTFEVDMGATNSYGAYVRDTYRFRTVGSKVVEVNDDAIGGFAEISMGDNSKKNPQPADNLTSEKQVISINIKYKQLFTNSTIRSNFPIGEIFVLKDSILAARSGAYCLFLRLDMRNNNEEDITHGIGIGDYKILPKGVRVEIIAVFNECKEKSLMVPSECNVAAYKIRVISGELKGEEWFVNRSTDV